MSRTYVLFGVAILFRFHDVWTFCASSVALFSVLTSIATFSAIRNDIEQRNRQHESWRWIAIEKNIYNIIKLSYIGRPIESDVSFERRLPDGDSDSRHLSCPPQIYVLRRSVTFSSQRNTLFLLQWDKSQTNRLHGSYLLPTTSENPAVSRRG